MTVQQALDTGKARLAESGIDSADLDARLLLTHVLGQIKEWLITHHLDELSITHQKQYLALIDRRAAREPLVHLTGSREFYGLDMGITPDVLTPRVETEQMVEWAVRYAPKDSSLIDIGTGSGAIAIAIAKHRPDLTITGTEVSPAALEVARGNAQRHEVAVTFLEADLWKGVTGTFSTIVTNLPYLRDDAREELMAEVKHEPDVALFGGPDGLDLYRRFLKGLPRHLEPGGYLFTECDPWQHEALIAEAATVGLSPVEQGYFILGFRLAA